MVKPGLLTFRPTHDGSEIFHCCSRTRWFVRPPTGRWRAVFLLSITMGTFHFGLFFIGISGVEASIAAIVFQLGIVFSVLFARLFLGEVFGVRRTIGMVVALVG